MRGRSARLVIFLPDGCKDILHRHYMFDPVGILPGKNESVLQPPLLGVQQRQCDTVGGVRIVAGDNTVVRTGEGFFYSAGHVSEELVLQRTAGQSDGIRYPDPCGSTMYPPAATGFSKR